MLVLVMKGSSALIAASLMVTCNPGYNRKTKKHLEVTQNQYVKLYLFKKVVLC